MRFLLDTDTCILLSEAREDIAVSVITEAELRTGAAKSSSSAKTLRLVENFIDPMTLIDFTSEELVPLPGRNGRPRWFLPCATGHV